MKSPWPHARPIKWKIQTEFPPSRSPRPSWHIELAPVFVFMFVLISHATESRHAAVICRGCGRVLLAQRLEGNGCCMCQPSLGGHGGGGGKPPSGCFQSQGIAKALEICEGIVKGKMVSKVLWILIMDGLLEADDHLLFWPITWMTSPVTTGQPMHSEKMMEYMIMRQGSTKETMEYAVIC